MSKTSFSRFLRLGAIVLGSAMVLASCGGSGESSPDDTRTRNAALGVSQVAITPPVVTGIETGWNTSLAVDADGRMYGFGTSGQGQLNVPALKAGATKFVAVSGGLWHSLALDDKGNMYGLGSNEYGQAAPPGLASGSTKFVAISAGGFHSLALDDKGKMYGFGSNGYGQTTTPALKNGGTKFTAIAAGKYSSLALDDKGNFYGFGSNGYGQTAAPAFRNGGTKFTAVSLGTYHSVALDDRGNFYGIGSNGYGQLNPPTLTDGATKFTAIAAGINHSLAIDDKGKLYGVGSNGYGQASPPILKKGATKFTAIAADEFHSLALDDKGNLYAFGSPGYGQTTLPAALSPSYARSMPIAMSGTTAYGIDENGDVVEFNSDWKPWEDGDIVSIAAGSRHGLAITTWGQVLGWGDNSVGQLNVPDISSALQVVAGYSYSAALRADGTVVEWGSHTAPTGRLITKPANLPKLKHLAGGLTHILGITTTGGVVGWGDNTSDKATSPTGLSEVISVAANAWCSVALKSNGDLVWWGGCPDSMTAKTSIIGGSDIALTEDEAFAIVNGSVLQWGVEENDITTSSDKGLFQALAAGADAVLAVTDKGDVISFGENYGDPIRVPEMFGGPAPIINDDICEDCGGYEPIVLTDEQVERDMAFYAEYLSPEQKAKAVKALGGSTDKPLTPEELQALIDAAKKEGRTDALATVKETIIAAAAPPPDPVTVTASTLPVTQNPVTKVNTTISTKQAVKLLGLKKATKVSFVVPKKASVSACKVTKTQVTTTGAGLCNVKVNYTDSKKKKQSTTLVVVVG